MERHIVQWGVTTTRHQRWPRIQQTERWGCSPGAPHSHGIHQMYIRRSHGCVGRGRRIHFSQVVPQPSKQRADPPPPKCQPSPGLRFSGEVAWLISFCTCPSTLSGTVSFSMKPQSRRSIFFMMPCAWGRGGGWGVCRPSKAPRFDHLMALCVTAGLGDAHRWRRNTGGRGALCCGCRPMTGRPRPGGGGLAHPHRIALVPDRGLAPLHQRVVHKRLQHAHQGVVVVPQHLQRIKVGKQN